MNIAVLSNVNMDPFKINLKKINIIETYFCGYGQYLIDLSDKNSMIYSNSIGIIFIHLDGEEFLNEFNYTLPEEKKILEYSNEILSLIENYIQLRPDVKVIISSLSFPPFSFINYLDSNSDFSYLKIENILNDKIYKLVRNNSNVILLDFNRIIKLYGYNNLYDNKYWYLGRIKYNYLGFQLIQEELESLLNAYNGKTKKVLILDLDNTIWGGVAGEDGVNGIKISEDGEGKIFRDFQKTVKAIKDIGIILAICSKNNENDIKDVFNNDTMMVLKYDDFIIKKINWKDKVTNILEISEELNLGVESFVFIDDNPAERELVRESIADIIVPEFPLEIENLKKWFLLEVVYKYFGKIRVTEEDKNKTKQYKNNFERNNLQKKTDINNFIKNLNIRLTL
ncbi:MAG: HAD-IIIC family phosphatase, partial [Smithella sp.]